MLLLYYSMYLFVGSICLAQGTPVTPAPGKQPQDASSLWTSSSSSSSNPTFRNHGKFQKVRPSPESKSLYLNYTNGVNILTLSPSQIHITNTNNPNPNPDQHQHPNTHSSYFISPSFLTNPNPDPKPIPPTAQHQQPKVIPKYGIFINHARQLQEKEEHPSSSPTFPQIQQHSTIKSSGWLPNTKNQEGTKDTPAPDLTQSRPSTIYALMRHLRRADRVWAPMAILFTMSWLAVMAMGVVECVGFCWRRVEMKGRKQRQGRFGGGGGGFAGWGVHHETVLFDGGGVLDEVVIEAVPVDDDDGHGQDQEDEGDRYKMLKMM